MKKYLFAICLLLCSAVAFAQPANDNCDAPINIPSGKEFCSADAAYTTQGATASFIGSGNDVWFTFTPRDAYDIIVTVYGQGNGGSLQSPKIRFFTNCGLSGGSYNEVFTNQTSVGNVTSIREPSLKINQTYYISVSGSNAGTFKLCLQNLDAPVKAGQDCVTARFLCSMDPVRELDINGNGNVKDEGAGTCLDNGDGKSETYSAWYKWMAANNGSLVFTITPTVTTDDLDWALFDLGTSGDCNAKSVVACADGSGVTCSGSGYYYKTGLDFNSVDVAEEAGCDNAPGAARDGKIHFINMIQGHIYALLINNPYSQGNGFTLTFTDQDGNAGTGEFVGPKADIAFTPNSPCVIGQTFTFSTVPSASTSAIKWTFGDDASLTTATTAGPFTISYTTLGTKTVVLEATGTNGCQTLSTQTFTVGLRPAPPVITAPAGPFCVGDTLRLSATAITGATYAWTGPNNYSGTGQTVAIPLTTTKLNGTYQVIVTDNGCSSTATSVAITSILAKPVAAFTTQPALPAKLSFPATVQFINRSVDADGWLWDFGDGTPPSTLENPEHTYVSKGDYTVKLTATNQNACTISVYHGTFVIREENTLFIPNTFTPNGDGINDELEVTITNMTNYQLRIYNRWGKLLFQTVSIFDNWNGTYRNEAMPVGTYYYIITAKNSFNDAVKRSGSITLLR